MKQVRVLPGIMLGLAFTLIPLSLAVATEETMDLAECIAELEAEAKAAEEEGTSSTEATLQDSISRFDECIKRMKLQSTGTMANSENESQSSNSLSGQSQIQGQNQNASESLSQSMQALDILLAEQQEQLDQEQAQRDLQTAAEQTKQAQDNPTVDEVSDQSSEQTSEEQLASQDNLPSEEDVRSKGGQHKSGERYPLDPEDEDIVLKTIRKAAETEQDPKTKADLWEEYYEYADKK
ncbi:MAG: hypothetical protein OXO49_08690 [Gammaproteobacteria bacterium]|nr:hypothetical protein [Gammaproteobacteria bacterium]MDE0252646.1 hypothetical protein [Gammaproteobacteria bacterium]MDE0403596.1 hypothetical protein [Gammaproteobacteria bacterium]